jgi:hypothetical protein
VLASGILRRDNYPVGTDGPKGFAMAGVINSNSTMDRMVIEVGDLADAMLAICLHERIARQRSAWGLARGEESVLVVDRIDSLPAEFVDSVRRFAPGATFVPRRHLAAVAAALEAPAFEGRTSAGLESFCLMTAPEEPLGAIELEQRDSPDSLRFTSNQPAARNEPGEPDDDDLAGGDHFEDMAEFDSPRLVTAEEIAMLLNDSAA